MSRSSQEEMPQRVGRIGDVEGSVAVGVGGGLALRSRSSQEEVLQGVGRVGDVDVAVTVGISAHAGEGRLRGGLDRRGPVALVAQASVAVTA